METTTDRERKQLDMRDVERPDFSRWERVPGGILIVMRDGSEIFRPLPEPRADRRVVVAA